MKGREDIRLKAILSILAAQEKVFKETRLIMPNKEHKVIQHMSNERGSNVSFPGIENAKKK
jgi:hypothetical protein